MPESWRTRLERWRFNLFPAFRGTGGRIEYVDEAYREIRVRIPLSWRTRNLVGTIFGGSLYGAVDPIYMVMLVKRLGADYVVWDKAATIRFLKPGRTTLYARFLLPDEEVEAVRQAVGRDGKTERTYTVEITDEEGEVHARVEKVVHVRAR